MLREHRLEHPAQPIVGYVLRYLSPIGSVDFPEPGRRTKRAPDKNGVCRMSAEGFYYIEPFEFPRVPVKGRYEVLLAEQSGKLIRTLGHVTIYVAFPSVRLYDGKFHYDHKGRIIWANEAPRAKPRRKRQRRPNEDATPSQSEREPAVSNTVPAPTASTATSASASAVNQLAARPASTERQYAELASKFDQLQQELSRVQQELSRIQRERDDDRLRLRAQKAELDEVKGLNKLLVYRNKRLQSERFPEGVRHAAPAETFAESQPDGHSGIAVAPSPVEVAHEPSMPVEAALQNELSMPLSTATPIGESDLPTPHLPIGVARQDESSAFTSSEPTPPQIAETRAPPAPKTDPPKPDWKSGGRSRQRQKQTAAATPSKKPPDGPLFGLAADNWRMSHRIR